MESLRNVFSTVPTEALMRVLEMCGQNVVMASAWLLENDWRDVMDAEYDHVAAISTSVMSDGPSSLHTANIDAMDATSVVSEHNRTMIVSTEGNNRQERNDSNDNHYDRRWMTVPPLTKRTKISKTRETKLHANEDDFWVTFDGQVVVKSMIELLNTTLSKLAHSKVVLLNQPALELDRAAATKKLKSVLALEETVDNDYDVTSGQIQSPRHAINRITMANLLNGDTPAGEKSRNSPSLILATNAISETSICQKRKRRDIAKAGCTPCQGFFAHFFPVGELDMVWRTVMHAHLLKRQFGEKIEFQTASGGLFRKRDFDELMHLQNSVAPSRAASISFSPLSMLKCCIILPCPANEGEMFRVGRNMHSILKVQGGLYYRVLDTPPFTSTSSPCDDRHELLNEADEMTEEYFRRFARYRIMEKEPITTGTTKVGGDPFMSYQEPRKTKYCLEVLDTFKWTLSLDD
ncbi:unnamed protein product [Peronospora belbahrii]|uniref:F-box domain-containing protein n=1 Tax=Peronospora belbahrii TaxID=622444 RepID=A0AAU9LEW0_9STRA|nr:unnamed protein product [Peronospora belbahrii]